jgi:hypothetical protein
MARSPKKVKPVPFSTDLFTYTGRDKRFVADASDLSLKPGQVLQKLTLQSSRTGNLMDFQLSSTNTQGNGEDEEVVSWTYTNPASGISVVLLND